MIDKPWNTLTGRMILVITTALVLAITIALVILQLRFDTVFLESIRSVQAAYAADAVRQLRRASDGADGEPRLTFNASIIGLWTTPQPNPPPHASRDPQIEDAVVRKAGQASDALLRDWTIEPSRLIEASLPEGRSFAMRGQSLIVLHVALQVEEGAWVNFLVQPRPRLWPPSRPIVVFLIISLVIVAIASSLVARRIAEPFRALTSASQRLAEGHEHDPIPVYGPTDVRRAQTAFNIMGARLHAKVLSQKALLAAIGHDLRTPLTALRVRAELLADAGDRERITRTLKELERLTEAALEAASDTIVEEPAQPVDIAGLAYAVCHDLADLGQPVRFDETDDTPIVEGWPDELGRALRNIVENAVRYGERAHVRLETAEGRCAIIVTDDGPGIPQADQARVFEPLVRLEGSRNRATGGHGLGLHIARNTALAHRGDIHLRNRDEGGLEVRIDLPLRA